MKPEWKGAAYFAEFAEAIGVPTDHVVTVTSMSLPRGSFMVLYSRDVEHEDTPVFARVFKRDGDGILRPDSAEREIPDFWKDLKATMERELRPDA